MHRLRNRLSAVTLEVLLLGLAGCRVYQYWQGSQTSQLDYDNPNPAPQTKLAPQPKESQLAQVLSVQDGDTIRVSLNGQEQRVRFCGIDAPELSQPLGNESRDYLQSLLARAENEVVLVVTDTDQYERLVAEVFVSAPTSEQPDQEMLLNVEQVVAGMAYVYPRYVRGCPNGELMETVEAVAEADAVGVWSGNHQKPWDYRQAQREN